MKLCSSCKTLKDEISYRKNRRKKDGLHGSCNVCEKQRFKNRCKQKVVILAKLEEHGCVYCGERDSIALDWHHKDKSTKLANIADLRAGKYSVSKFLKELEKCELVCSKCHRKIEAGENLTKMEELLPSLACIRMSY
jgi:hypothetical protein